MEGMHKRCYNKQCADYPAYGGRGIVVCDEWHDPVAFYQWALANGYQEHLTIERLDNNDDYAPDNCAWIENWQQARNRRARTDYSRRGRIIVTGFGETKTLPEWARDARCVVTYDILRGRVCKKGWPLERAMITPQLFKKRW
jgi:hypothetical protein